MGWGGCREDPLAVATAIRELQLPDFVAYYSCKSEKLSLQSCTYAADRRHRSVAANLDFAATAHCSRSSGMVTSAACDVQAAALRARGRSERGRE